MKVVGVDPGWRDTGIVARDGAELIAHDIYSRPSNGMPTAAEIDDLLHAIWVVMPLGWRGVTVAVEGINPLRGLRRTAGGVQQGTTNPKHSLGTAVLVGAVYGAFSHIDRAVIVPPAKHGQRELADYPPELVGARETSGGGRLRHCRSAWDVAGWAMTYAAVTA